LQQVPNAHIHAPWEAQRLPDAYPPPVADHAECREIALERFAEARQAVTKS
jgi:deoxyribodipyrimidine photolyase